jgi:hypothetical protein
MGDGYRFAKKTPQNRKIRTPVLIHSHRSGASVADPKFETCLPRPLLRTFECERTLEIYDPLSPLCANLLAVRAAREDIPRLASTTLGFHNLFAFSSAFAIKYTMTDEDERELETELARLQQEHRDLDAAIDALHQSPAPDLLRLQRLKKRKLQLRDRIAFIEDQITPDIIA